MEWNPDPSLYPAYLRNRVKRGFGIGTGVGYRPWLRVRDVPSAGTSATILGIRVGRRYELLSTREAIYFYLSERMLNVIDIREQFPILDLSGTLRICAEYGFRHPYDGASPRPFTIDFLLTVVTPDGVAYQGKSVKTPEDASDPQVQEKLQPERLWCESKAISWTLIDTTNFTDDVLATLRFIRGWFRHRHQLDVTRADRFAQTFLRHYQRNVPLKELVEIVAARLRVSYRFAENEFRYCCWSDRLPIDLQCLVALDHPLFLKEH